MTRVYPAIETAWSDRWWYRICATPVWMLARGRVPARLDVAGIIADAELPAALAALVRMTVKRTRLWRVERVDVAPELIAHFQDGLAAGATAESLAATFGDPAQTARLIRRAKRRARPWLYRVVEALGHAWLVLIGLLVVLYGVGAARLYLDPPHVAHDYVADWNASRERIPIDARAWPLYREAATVLRQPADGSSLTKLLDMGDRAAQENVLAQNAAALRLYRVAAARPQLGALLGGEAPVGAALYDVQLPQIGALQNGVHLLLVDMSCAARERNGARVVADALAIAGICRHLRQMEFVVTDVCAIRVAEQLVAGISRVVADNADVLDHDQWQTVAHTLAALGFDSDAAWRTEREIFADYVQRHYTPGGLPTSDVIKDEVGTPSAWRVELLRRTLLPPVWPIVSQFMASADAAVARYTALLNQSVAESYQPLWQLKPSAAEAKLEQLRRDVVGLGGRWLPVIAWLPGVRPVALFEQYTRQRRDVVLTAIALELYRREHGTWPEELAALVPELLPSMPLDRYDGQVLKYRLRDGVPRLYSVGVDRDDDGGVGPDVANLPANLRRDAEARVWRWRPADEAAAPRYDGDWVLWTGR